MSKVTTYREFLNEGIFSRLFQSKNVGSSRYGIKTLCIHPRDASTDFLLPIVEDKDWTIFNKWSGNYGYPGEDNTKIKYTGGVNSIEELADYDDPNSLYNLIKSHDRIVMMGHGTPNGLLGMYNFFMYEEIINLLQKKETISIWCNADKYVEKHGLKGFYTGMFISELEEAEWEEVPATLEEVDLSNETFVELYKDMTENMDVSKLKYLKEEYLRICNNSPVSIFNTNRLYYK